MLRRQPSYMSFDDAVADFPPEHINTRPPNVTYTPWHLLEHMHLTQRDILDYIENPTYREPHWPDGYWPAANATADAKPCNGTIRAFKKDLLEKIATDSGIGLSAPLPYAPKHTFFRERVIVAEHNAFHIGEVPPSSARSCAPGPSAAAPSV